MSELLKCLLCGAKPITRFGGALHPFGGCPMDGSQSMTPDQWNLLMGGGEPVAWMYKTTSGRAVSFNRIPDDDLQRGTIVTPLYTRQQAAQPQQIGFVHRDRIGNPSTSLISDLTYRAAVEDPDDYVPVYMQPQAAQVDDAVVLDCYDAGHLNDHGGGNVGWWQDYIRAELARAHDFYQSQIDAAMKDAAMKGEG